MQRGHATSHDKAVLLPRRYQSAPRSRKAWHMLVMLPYQHQSSISTTHPVLKTRRHQLHQCSDPCWIPLKISTFMISPLYAAARGKGRGQAPSHRPIPSVSTTLLHFPVWDFWGFWEMRKGRERHSEERRPEDQEEHVTTANNTLLQKPLRR